MKSNGDGVQGRGRGSYGTSGRPEDASSSALKSDSKYKTRLNPCERGRVWLALGPSGGGACPPHLQP